MDPYLGRKSTSKPNPGSFPEIQQSNIFRQKFYGKCNILRPMSVQNFSSIGSTLVEISADSGLDDQKPHIFAFLQIAYRISRFSNSGSAKIHQIISSTTYPKMRQIREPRLSSLSAVRSWLTWSDSYDKERSAYQDKM